MFRNSKVLGIIPARGGSRRLPGKNILQINGKPLIGWTIEAGCGSARLDKIVVSTEDENIAQVARAWNAVEVFNRSKALATDDASTCDVVLEVVECLTAKGEQYGYVVVLQPTSPLRTETDIDEAFELIEEKEAIGAIGVCETEHPVEWMGKIPPSRLLDSFFRETELTRRSQDYMPSFLVNGAIYIVPVNRLQEEKTFFLKNGMVAYLMDRKESIDIDNEYDMQLAEWRLRERTNREN